ncbi:SDR family oxidoreductase [Halobacillus sp. A1]|uniref:SDR family NAD(P)-dependent oxidoreductase n=1 Tax=Halobacillus sp. A1 TaxID=2880262 RepID=UPI0020A6B5E4|nr:SDR family NAD(P)-dependent oxidoreductase [Halobacillus sp. A1]MCP3031876.1 SDR family oxidoreductase [Halobacillus sp. A1]
MGKLDGKVAMVTGGGQGIGRAIVELLALNGAIVVIADYQLENSQEAAKEIGGRVSAKKADVRSSEQVQSVIEGIVHDHERLDIIVNNAGISTMDTVVNSKEEDWDQTFNVNAKGVYLCCKYGAKQMIDQGGDGKIINISSQAGKNGYKYLGSYSASKHAVLGLTKVLALELADYQINVNAVCPGIVETDMKRNERKRGGALRGLSALDVEAEDHSQVPLGRTATPEDVAHAVLFLASSGSDYITGESVNVTGGMTMN